MPHPKPQWVFTCTGHLTWAWQDVAKGDTANSFTGLDDAMADATIRGFDPLIQYWVALSNGRATHFRPGKRPITIPASEEPSD